MNLVEELSLAAERCRRRASRHRIAALVLVCVALVASAVATVMVLFKAGSPQLQAVLVALPGIAALASATLKFEEKSRWHRRKLRGIGELLHELRYAGATEAQVSARYVELLRETDADYPGFGDVPVQPVRPRSPVG